MRLLLSIDEHFDYLTKCIAAKPKRAIISTYGIWAGVMPDGRDIHNEYPSKTRELLESMKEINTVNILVGLYELKSCRGKVQQCPHCERKYVLDLFRIMSHADLFAGFSWRIKQQLHAKYTLFEYDDGWRGVAGGRNFTDSSWSDITIELDAPSINPLLRFFVSEWKLAKPLNAKTVGGLVDDAGISEKTMNTIKAGF